MEEKKGSWWKENSTFVIPAIALILLLVYAIFTSQQGALVLATPSAAECAKALIAQAEAMGAGKKFRLEVVEEGTFEAMNEKDAVALIAPFSPDLFSSGALPIAVDALVVGSIEGRNLNQEEISSLEKKGKFFYPPKDLWAFYSYRIGQVSKSPRIFSPGGSLAKDAVAFVSWSRLREANLKIGSYNGMLPTEKSISGLQYPLWYQVFLFTSGDQAAKEADIDLLLKAAKEKAYQKFLRDLGFYPWPEK